MCYPKRFGRLILMGFLLLTMGCGFHLRGELPEAVKEQSLAMTGISKSNPLYVNFVQKLTVAGGVLAAKPSEAFAIINVIKARQLRRPITLSAVGRANMFDLSFLLVFEVQTPKGKVLMPERELVVRREYFNTQSSPLGQGLEETQIRIEMENEAAQQLLRQVLAGLKNEPPAAP